ncbi:hypothetical protein NE857_18765 [Nocardiopsis exhalans]|uniref:Uncharacterized protein n=1 Tax=Nocardiopsis exhalans TaxID=163604 RepID=A0ABY5D1I2_9ACTN|nr:hypothetical protein [Nocardiopsis exhalans]USY17388.1 hypothetical protein NE857_18765 [Nocardiopsis exhalans]
MNRPPEPTPRAPARRHGADVRLTASETVALALRCLTESLPMEHLTGPGTVDRQAHEEFA